MDRAGRVTIEDVAARAGVHAATVSRALNRPEKVAPATRARIEAVVAELDFVPSRAAAGLITGRTGNVAVIVPDITNPHFAGLVQAAGRAARDGDLQLLLVDTGEHDDEEVRAARTLSREVDGFIVVSPRRLHGELDALGGTPAVFVNRPVDGHPSIVMRTAGAVTEAVVHLAGLGHRRLAYLGGPAASWAAGERRAAVVEASGSSGIEVVDLGPAAPRFEAGADAVSAVATGVTAVFAFNAQMALGVVAGLSRRGVAVPGEISVVAGDDIPMAPLAAPPLTAVALPTEAAGTEAVRLLAEGHGQVELEARFEPRASTGPAPA